MIEQTNHTEIIKTVWVTHLGTATINQFGAVTFEANAGDKVICHIQTLRELLRELNAQYKEIKL